MSEIDKRKKLLEEPFNYKITKKGTVIIYFDNKQIKIIKDREAESLIKKIKEAESDIAEIQLLLAKITGNFKRGNERLSRNKGKK